MKIALGCDHGGLTLKNQIAEYLSANGYEILDLGTTTYASCDYPDYGVAAAEAVANGSCERGIVVCTTGVGISIAANKVPGIRCALCSEPLSAKMTRLHNDANMLALGGGIVAPPSHWRSCGYSSRRLFPKRNGIRSGSIRSPHWNENT